MINPFTFKDNNGNMHFLSDYIRVLLENNYFDKYYIKALKKSIKTKTPNKKIDITQDTKLFKTIFNQYKIIKHSSPYSDTYYTFTLIE